MASSTRSSTLLNRLAAWIVPVACLLLALALLLPGLAGFPYPDPQAHFSDLSITHYPYAIYLRASLLEGRFPLWSPGILSGAPFAANPLSGLWYPPGWPALLFPLPLGFNLMVALHLAWGGWGLYLLLRREGLEGSAALFGAATFVLLPKLYAHYGAGHLTLLYAVPWTPWLLLAAHRRRGRWEAIILALIFTADPRWAVYAGLAWLGYVLIRTDREAIGVTVRRLAGRTLLAGLLAAPLALPLLEFARLSTRSALTASDMLAFSLPPARLLGLLYPDFGGFHEFMLYTGQAVLALALIAILGVRRSPFPRFWGWAALVSMIWSLGEALPPLALVARLPGLDLLRVPSRALFLAGMALICLAAHAVHALTAGQPEDLPVGRLRRVRLALAGLVALSLALTLGVTLVSGTLPLNFAWGSAFLLLTVIWVGLRLSGRFAKRLSAGTWLGGLALLALLDAGGLDRSLFANRSAAEVLGEGEPAAVYLTTWTQPEAFRVYSPSYSLPQHTAARYRLELADGVDPLQMQAYADYMGKASGVPPVGYSVTVPPFAPVSAPQTGDASPQTGEASPVVDPSTANAAFLPDAERLGKLNVAYVAAAFDLFAPGLMWEAQFGETRLYRNLERRGAAWIESDSPLPGSSAVEIVSRSPERIELRAQGPGLLVLSEIAYPGWIVQVDGIPHQMLTAENLLRAVRLPPGDHPVVFSFRPLSVYAGLALAAIAWLFLLVSAWLSGRRSVNRALDDRPETQL